MATKMYRATVTLLVPAETDREAADAISGLLSETGLYEEPPFLTDWSYQKSATGYIFAEAVLVPDDYDRDEDSPFDLVPA